MLKWILLNVVFMLNQSFRKHENLLTFCRTLKYSKFSLLSSHGNKSKDYFKHLPKNLGLWNFLNPVYSVFMVTKLEDSSYICLKIIWDINLLGMIELRTLNASKKESTE